MKKLFSLTAVLMTVCILMCGMGASAVKNGISVMCVGASNTYGNKVPGGYRSRLYKRLTAANIPVTFVGPNTGNPSGDLPADSVGHAGYGGSYIGVIAEQIDGWMQAYRPQVVCLMMGTNDMLQNNKNRPDDTREGAPERYSALIDRMMAICPDSEYYVANITSLGTGWNQYVLEYNAAVEAMLETKPSNVHFVDVYSACPDRSTDIQSDGIHITAEGYEKVAQAFYDVMQPKLSTMEPSGTSGLIKTSHNGNYMLEMATSGTNSWRNAASSDIKVEDDSDYEFSFWVKGEAGTTIMPRISDVNVSWTTVVDKSIAPGPNWVQYKLTFNTNKTTTKSDGNEYTVKKVKVTFNDNSAKAGKVYIDDVELKKVGSDVNIVSNPGFETGKEGWTLQSLSNGTKLFSVVSSKTYVVPPKSYTISDKEISKTINIDFEDYTGTKPNQVYVDYYDPKAYYTNPYEVTTTFMQNNNIYLEDKEDGTQNGCLMFNASSTYKTPSLKLNKSGYNDITWFNEMQFKFKLLRRTDGSVDYSKKKTSDYKFTIWLQEAKSKTTTPKLTLEASQFDGDYETVTISRSDLKGGTLDVDGALATDSNNEIRVCMQPKGGITTFVDDIKFIWYAGGDVQEITSVNFKKDGESLNVKGIRAGEITVEADAKNTGASEVADAALAAAVVEKSTNKIVDIGIAKYSVPAQGEAKGIACTVTVPQDYANYEIRVMHMENLAKFRPAVPVMTFDTNGASGQE